MNILFISSARTWGGGEVWLEQICVALNGRGHNVVVACRPQSKLFDRLTASSIRAFPLNISGDFNPFTIAKLHHIVKKFGVNIICTGTDKELRLGGIAAMVAGVPVVVSREVDFPIKNTAVNRFYYTRVAAGMIVNSHATYNTMLVSAPWLKEQDIEIIWKGIPIDEYESGSAADIREENNLDPQDCIAGFLGRLDEQKGIPTLLDAMKVAVQSQPRLKLVLAGVGNLSDTIDAFRRDNHLEKHIFMSGFRSDVGAFLRGIDFLVMPSYWEGFGYSAVEAMASGKAVIGTYSSSLPEIIENGRTGFLVPPRSADDLSEAMVRLANDHELCKLMGRAGFSRANRLFQQNRMIIKTELFFEKIVKAHFKPHPGVAYIPISEHPELPLRVLNK